MTIELAVICAQRLSTFPVSLSPLDRQEGEFASALLSCCLLLAGLRDDRSVQPGQVVGLGTASACQLAHGHAAICFGCLAFH